MKKTARWVFSAVVFVLCGLMLFGRVSEILRRKVDKYTDMMHTLYDPSGEHGTIDVVGIGSSHGYWGFQSNCLWGEYGITALNMSSPRQSVASSYYVLREVLKYEHPKVVALESYYFYNDGKFAEDEYQVHVRKAFDGLRLDEVKHEMIQDFYGDESLDVQLSLYVPFIQYHSRWQELADYDFNSHHFLRGSMLGFTPYPMEDPGMPESGTEVPQVNLDYLDRIAQLCEENDIALVVYAAPMGSDDDSKRYLRDQGVNLTLERYLKEKGIPFLFYQKQGEVAFDFATDFVDTRHLNTNGGIKLSQHLGAWLQRQYALEDHRGDEAYRTYEEDYEKYLEAVEEERLAEAQ